MWGKAFQLIKAPDHTCNRLLVLTPPRSVGGARCSCNTKNGGLAWSYNTDPFTTTSEHAIFPTCMDIHIKAAPGCYGMLCYVYHCNHCKGSRPGHCKGHPIKKRWKQEGTNTINTQTVSSATGGKLQVAADNSSKWWMCGWGEGWGCMSHAKTRVTFMLRVVSFFNWLSGDVRRWEGPYVPTLALNRHNQRIPGRR